MSSPPDDNKPGATGPVQRRTTQSLPPPIPRAKRSQPLETRSKHAIALLEGPPESPTVLDKARVTEHDHRARLERALELAGEGDPARAASLAYELGQLHERFGKDQQALDAYRRALGLDPSLLANRWALRHALYRGALWPELVKLVDAEIEHVDDPVKRVDLILERALVQPDEQARASLTDALSIVTRDQRVLLELERIVARTADRPALLDILEHLAIGSRQVERKLSAWLEVARVAADTDFARARVVFEALGHLAVGSRLAESVMRERLRLTEAHGTPADMQAAAAALESVLTDKIPHSGTRRRELIGLHRRQAQLGRASDPQNAWHHLQQALALAPDEPVVLVDLVELAAELGSDELPAMVSAWHAADATSDRAAMVSWWCANRRGPLVKALSAVEPGFILVTAACECGELGEPASSTALADTYLDAARAARAGTWRGSQSPTEPDASAAIALYLQAAELLAYHANTPQPEMKERARTVLQLAQDLAPDHPAVIEALVELEDCAGPPEAALVRLRELAGTSPHPEMLERSIRIAASHGMSEAVGQLQRRIHELVPTDVVPVWRLDATLFGLGRDRERAELLGDLVRNESDPARRGTALLAAARLIETPGQAVEHYRRLHALWPDDVFVRDALVDELRAAEQWPELVEVRLEEARAGSELRLVRRALREAAWVLEVKLGDVTRAAAVYTEWLERIPDDRVALEACARCYAAIDDYDQTHAMRARIVELDPTPETRWLYARSLERGGQLEDVVAQYRLVAADDESSLAAVSATIALGDLASRSGDPVMHAESTAALARRTNHAQLAAGLFEQCGWIQLLALGAFEDAARSFADALALQPAQRGALFGTAAAAACGADLRRQEEAYAELAAAGGPGVATALLLRAAALADASGDAALARERTVAAHRAAPDDVYALVAAAEREPFGADLTGEPLVAVGELTSCAETLGNRAALSDDPAARASWELDRAEQLELAGELREAVRVLGEVLEARPQDKRAIAAVRRIADRAGDNVRRAQASFALAKLSHDPANKVQLLREAASVFGPDSTYAITIYRQLIAIDPSVAEFDRLCEALYARGESDELVGLVTRRLGWLVKTGVSDELMVPLLVERAMLLRTLGDFANALSDLDAVLEHTPTHRVAAKLRAELGKHSRPASFVEEVSTRPRAMEEVSTGAWAREAVPRHDTEPSAAPDSGSFGRTTPLDESTVKRDPFGSSTVRVDLSSLQEEEQQLARKDRAVTVPGKAITDKKPAVRVPRLPWARAAATGAEPPLDVAGMRLPEEPAPSESSEILMVSYDEILPQTSKAFQELMIMYEREIALVDEPEVRIEAGRLSALNGETDRAREHYTAAIAADPRATAALRGLRRLTREPGEKAALVAAEMAVASGAERDALAHYHIDLLLAAGEHDLARAAVSALVERLPGDSDALLTDVLLGLRDPSGERLPAALDGLDRVIDPELRAPVKFMRGVVAQRRGDAAGAARAFSNAADSEPASLALRLEAIRHGTDQHTALLDLAYHVESEDPIMAAALALMRASSWLQGGAETIAAAAQLATRTAARDPLVARIVAESALVTEDHAIASLAFARWARAKAPAVERAYAAARAAELDPARLGRMWAQVMEADRDDDYACARLRAAHLASDMPQDAIDLDLEVARETEREVPIVRAAAELMLQGELDVAIDRLAHERARRPGSWALAEALAGVLAKASRWRECAALLGELAASPGPLAASIVRSRCAVAWDQTTRTSTDAPTAVAALGALELVLGDDPKDPTAHGTAIRLARGLDDPAIMIDVLERARLAESSRWAASSLALRRARLHLRDDPRLAIDVAQEAVARLDDPRCTLVVMLAAARRNDLSEAAGALAQRADRLDAATGEPAMLRVRAARLALEAGDLGRAKRLLSRVALPGLCDDLRARAGEQVAPNESFTRLLHDADLAAATDNDRAAFELYERALALKPGDPLAAGPLVRIARRLQMPGPVSAYALELLRSAQAVGDGAARAEAYELMALVDHEMRGDANAAWIALESAVRSDPGRVDLLPRLERELGAARRYTDLVRVRERAIDELRRAPDGAGDLAAVAMDTATVAVRDHRPDAVLERLYRIVVDINPRDRRALFHLEAILRRGARHEELAKVEEQIADCFDDPLAKVAFLTKAGMTLAAHRNAAAAIQRFARALELVPNYAPALDAWYETALTGELWTELADAATRKARLADEPKVAAELHHLAGVALMDKAGDTVGAIAALERAFDADPSHVDTFIRLRILLESDLERRVAVFHKRLGDESDPTAVIELHNLLAEHSRGAGDRDAALRHYQEMIAVRPKDVRAHTAIADIAGEQGNWQEAADALTARIGLENDSETLKSLYYRLGVLYAEHDTAKALAALQRVLTYEPTHADTLIRVTDLAIGAGEWKLALGTCEELVRTQRAPHVLALHLLRAATIFGKGLGDHERADKMMELAQESDPTSTDVLRHRVSVFQDKGDKVSLKMYLDRVAESMRERIAQNVKDGPAYRLLSRAVEIRAEATGDGSYPIARAAAELAQLLGAGLEAEQRLAATPSPLDVSLLAGPVADELLFSGSEQPAVREVFRLLGDPLAKHVGIKLGVYGVGRKERLRDSDAISEVVRGVAASIGLADVVVYVSTRQPYAMVAEPTNPVSLVLGREIIRGPVPGIRFAAGAALKLAQMSLAIPARLPPDELAVVGLALLRLFRPELTSPGVDLDAVDAHAAKLRRLIQPPLFEEARPHATAVESFNAHAFARDLSSAGIRAGLAASGSVIAALANVAATLGSDPLTMLDTPIARALVMFALGDARARF